MALGAITLTSQQHGAASAPLQIVEISMPGDGAYPTGGSTGFQTALRAALGRDVTIINVAKAAATGVYTPIWDKANSKLYVEDAAGAQVANGTDLSATVFKLWVYCI